MNLNILFEKKARHGRVLYASHTSHFLAERHVKDISKGYMTLFFPGGGFKAFNREAFLFIRIHLKTNQLNLIGGKVQ